jgi:DNA-binding transcriptional MerR regulator
MATTRFPLLVRRPSSGSPQGSLLTLQEIARLVGIHPELVDKLMALGLIDPTETTPEPLFDVATILRIRRILRLRHDLGVNWVGIGIVLDLLAKVEALEQEIVRLQRR